MLRTRILVAIVAMPIMIGVVVFGGVVYNAAIVVVLALGVRELIMLGKAEGYAPSLIVSLIVLLVLLLGVYWPEVPGPGVALGVMLAMGSSLYHFYHGDETPLNSFAITLGIALALGWMGQYLLRVRALPDGAWWTLTVLICTFAADTGAYAFGKRFGRHKMSPKASPKKSWEGYFGGIVFTLVMGPLFAGVWGLGTANVIGPLDGLLLGAVIAAVSPLGDLTVSMFKRQAHRKDASALIPGHGGMMDRLDTVLIAFALGFYYILWVAPLF